MTLPKVWKPQVSWTGADWHSMAVVMAVAVAVAVAVAGDRRT